MRPGERNVSLGCVSVWFPKRVASLRQLLLKAPEMHGRVRRSGKKWRGPRDRSSKSSSAGVIAGFGPSSNVSAKVGSVTRPPDRRPEELRGRRYGGPCEYPAAAARPRPQSQYGIDFIRQRIFARSAQPSQQKQSALIPLDSPTPDSYRLVQVTFRAPYIRQFWTATARGIILFSRAIHRKLNAGCSLGSAFCRVRAATRRENRE